MCSISDVLFDQSSQNMVQRLFLTNLADLDCASIGPQLMGDPQSSVPQHRIKNIHVFFEWASTTNVNPVMSTFAALIAVYLSPTIRNTVINHSRADRAREYFSTFDSRFETYVCGETQKAKVIVKQAKTPTEMVIAEWLFFIKLTHRYR